MSNQNHAWRKIIATVAVIAIVLIVFIFLINKTMIWQTNDNGANILQEKVNLDSLVISPIKDRQEIEEIISELEEKEKTENLDLIQAVGLMDRLVENSNMLFVARLDYKELGIESKEFETSLEEYYNSVVESIDILNFTEWQKVSNDKFVMAATAHNSKNKMFDEFYVVLDNLDNVFEEMDKLVIVDLDKPFQCGLPNTRTVYLCENGYYKITNYSGFDFYDDQGQRVDSCNCKQLKCFEDNNLCK